MRVSLDETSQAEWQSKNCEGLRYDYDLQPADLVIDIGAYRGEWAEEIYQRYACQIIAVEPGPWILDFHHGEVVNEAAWSNDGRLPFGGSYYYSSQFEPATHEYPCFDINSLLEKYPEIALLKINTEGAEYHLLEHIIMGQYHHRVRNFQVQFHQIEGVPYEQWYDQIVERLSLSHSLTWRFPFCWENWRIDA